MVQVSSSSLFMLATTSVAWAKVAPSAISCILLHTYEGNQPCWSAELVLSWHVHALLPDGTPGPRLA